MQTTNTLLMIRPMQFGFNEETAESNAFQDANHNLDQEEARLRGIEEFDAFVNKLSEKEVDVIVVRDFPEPKTPDAVFPNNWISFHSDGSIVLYPMNAPVRRLERRPDIIDSLKSQYKFEEVRRIDLTHYEATDQFLEGTGSMVLDRVNRIAYACLSPRTNETVLNDFCAQMNYRPIAFTALDGKNQEIYHTNVMMSIGEKLAIVCLDAVRSKEDRQKLEKAFKETNKEILNLSPEQMNEFAGNMLEVKNTEGKSFMVMSQQAYDSLFDYQVESIENHCGIISSSLETIEALGGGSARCMMAEVFLPKQQVNTETSIPETSEEKTVDQV